MRRGLAALLVAAAALAGCGGGSDGGQGTVRRALDARAAGQEVSATKRGLDAALERYREGDRGAASDALAATRGEHFAAAESALAKAAPAITRRLRTALATELPKLIDDGVTVSVLARRLVAVERDLDAAVVRLGTP